MGKMTEAMPGPVPRSRIHKGRAGCQGPRARGPFSSSRFSTAVPSKRSGARMERVYVSRSAEPDHS